jgi:hypothetical protein
LTQGTDRRRQPARRALGAALVAVACAAINVALTLGLEVIIFAARAWMRVPPPLE